MWAGRADLSIPPPPPNTVSSIEYACVCVYLYAKYRGKRFPPLAYRSLLISSVPSIKPPLPSYEGGRGKFGGRGGGGWIICFPPTENANKMRNVGGRPRWEGEENYCPVFLGKNESEHACHDEKKIENSWRLDFCCRSFFPHPAPLKKKGGTDIDGPSAGRVSSSPPQRS